MFTDTVGGSESPTLIQMMAMPTFRSSGNVTAHGQEEGIVLNS